MEERGTYMLSFFGTCLRILLVCPDQSECDSLVDILQCHRCRLYHVGTCGEAVSFLYKHRVEVVISSCDLPDGTWKDLLKQPKLFSSAPNLIVASRNGNIPI